MPTYNDSFTASIIDSTANSYASLTLTQNTQLVWSAYLPPNPPLGVVYFTAAAKMDVTTNSNLVLFLPQGNQGSAGANILITNRSATAFTVADSAGQNTTLVGAGASYYFVLTSNATIAGTWSTVAFGAGTGQADANLLAGFGLTSLYGRLNENIPVVQFSGSGYSLADTDRAKAFVWQGGQGGFTLPSGALLSPGWFIWLRNNGSGDFVIRTSGSATFNGLTSVTYGIGTSTVIVYDSLSGNFFGLGTVSAQQFAFSSAIYDTSSILTNTYSLVNGAPIIQKYVDLSLTRSADLLIQLPATASLYAFINQTNTSAYRVLFQIAGSAQAPIVVANGTQSFVSADGNNLYVLASSTLGTLQLNDGSASTPSLNFINESNTGLYRAANYQVGFSVGSNPFLILDGSDFTNPIVRSPALGVFKAIDGGLI